MRNFLPLALNPGAFTIQPFVKEELLPTRSGEIRCVYAELTNKQRSVLPLLALDSTIKAESHLQQTRSIHVSGEGPLV